MKLKIVYILLFAPFVLLGQEIKTPTSNNNTIMKLKIVCLFLFSPFILLGQNLTVASGDSITIPKDSYVNTVGIDEWDLIGAPVSVYLLMLL